MLVQQNQTITLPDRRKLGYAEYGDPNGTVVFFLHGQPGNRLFHPNPEITRQAGIRLVIPDRLGYGLSDDIPHAMAYGTPAEKPMTPYPSAFSCWASGRMSLNVSIVMFYN